MPRTPSATVTATTVFVLLLCVVWAAAAAAAEPSAGGGASPPNAAGGYTADDDVPPRKYSVGDLSVFQENAREGLVTVVFANNVYFEQGLVQNLHCSWRRIGFESYVIVAVDAAAHDNLQLLLQGQRKAHWAPGWWRGVGGGLLRPTNVKTPGYVSFIHRRTRFIEHLLLATTLDVLLCDADTVWTRDLIADGTVPYSPPHMKAAGTARCDAFVVNSAHRGGLGSESVEPLGGFLLARNTDNTRLWYRTWTAMEACLQSKEQPAMHASLRVLHAHFARPFRVQEDVGARGAAVGRAEPVLCVLHDAHFPTGFHMSYGYLKDYPDVRAIALGHASISDKANKEEWMRRHGWWLLTPSGECLVDSLGWMAATSSEIRPSERRRLSGVKNLEVVHWMKEGPGGRQCTPYMQQRLPVLRRQVAEAVEGRVQQMLRAAEEGGGEQAGGLGMLPRFTLHAALVSVLLVIVLQRMRGRAAPILSSSSPRLRNRKPFAMLG